MLVKNIAEISESAGVNNDGVVRGTITESLLVAAYESDPFATQYFVTRKDVNAGTNYTDLSAEAVAGVPNGFLPFGTDGQMSATDEVWIAADKNICAIYVKITTSGVWTGTGITVLEDLGAGLVPVANLVDDSNGLRAAPGIYRISFDLNPNRIDIAPEYDGILRKYVVIRLDGFVSKTTSPKLERIWLQCQGTQVSYHDRTAYINGGTNDTDFTGLDPEVFHVPENANYYGFSNLTIGHEEYDLSPFTFIPTYTIDYEYLASDMTWKPLQNVFTSNPVTIGSAIVRRTRWALPTDWTEQHLFTGDLTIPIPAYWIRERIASTTVTGPTNRQRFRRRGRTLGSGLAVGMSALVPSIYQSISFDLGVPAVTDMRLMIINGTTIAERNIVIPSGVYSTHELPLGRIDFSSPLLVPAGDHLLLMWAGGGMVQDIEITLS